MTEVIDVEAEEVGQDLEVREAAPPTLLSAPAPEQSLSNAVQVAKLLNDVVKKQHLFKRIGQKDHIYVEGWTCLGSLVGVYPRLVWTHEIESGWEARVEAVNRDGFVVGVAEAMCTRNETTWADRTDQAIRSMAQTRATSKALRMPLGYIAVLAGFDSTPGEEVESKRQTAKVPAHVTAFLKLADQARIPRLTVREKQEEMFPGKDATAMTEDDTAALWAALQPEGA